MRLSPAYHPSPNDPVTTDFILGVDEVGTGAIVGPFVVAGVLLHRNDVLPGVRDSKKMKPHQREAGLLTISTLCISATVIQVEPEEMERLGHHGAWCSAVTRVVVDTMRSVTRLKERTTVVIDGDMHYDPRSVASRKTILRHVSAVRFMTKADDKVPAVSAASVVAKVTRDALMQEAHQAHPLYGWDRNKGYGTPEHLAAIQIHGLTPMHRKLKALNNLNEESRSS